MKKILFVDDEQAILDSLLRALRKHRRRWDMTFANSGEAAILEMSNKDYDVVVSDIRMPGVNGVDVLRYAKDKHPKAIRIALTGYADKDSTMELTTLAQRFLTKPCAVEDLDEAITRDSGLIEAFDNPVVQELAGSAGRLPASENSQQKLLDRLNSSDGSIEDIAKVIEEDFGLTAKILQLANSSFFRRQSSVVSARLAVSYLGLDVIRSLVLANQLFQRSEAIPKMDYFDVDALRQHSLLTSTIAREIAPNAAMASVAMTAGLLLDIGKIIIALEKPESIGSLVNVAAGAPYDWVDPATERDILGCTHAEVGGCFLNLWGVPTPIVEAVTFHDDPTAVFNSEFDAVGVVHVSNYLAHWGASRDGGQAIEKKLNREYLQMVEVADREELWKGYVAQILSESSR
jgi:HD-like signal output (HDOD) protein/CheY-like chemotaxis protein